VQTRDDIRFAQGKNGKFCLNPGLAHFKALKHTLRFLKGTLDYGIEFNWTAVDKPKADGPLTIEAWSDSSFADDIDTAKSTIGYVIKVNGATITASSKLSSRVDSCVNHSELRACASAVDDSDCRMSDGAGLALLATSRTVAWARGVKAALEQRDPNTMPPTPVYVDNSGVLAMINDPTVKPANRHIYRSLAETRERVHVDSVFIPVKIDTADNLADAMTKQPAGLAASAATLRKITGPRTRDLRSTELQSGGRVGQ